MTCPDVPESFEDLATSRREWIESVLRPWCRQAGLKQLRQAEREWHDFAGRVDVEATLWTWAWERHPVLVHDDMAGVNETHAVKITLHDGRTATGFPDARRSLRGQLCLEGPHADADQIGPFSIDEILEVSSASLAD